MKFREFNQLSVKIFIILILVLVFSIGLFAQPMPWMLSNLDPLGETTFIYDENSEIIEDAVLIQLILDMGGDGPNAPSAHPETYGEPTENDILVTSAISWPEPGVCPLGSFVLFTDIDVNNPSIPSNARAYIRVFADVNPIMGTPFLDSDRFYGPVFPEGVQTIVKFPPGMTGYIGNDRPALYASPSYITVQAGDEAIISLSADDSSEILEFSVVSDSLPGDESAILIRDLSHSESEVSWIPPFDATGVHLITCNVTDGQWIESRVIEVTVTEGAGNPSAFHLESPETAGTLWSTVGFSWNESLDPENEDVEYTLIWGSDSLLTMDVDSIAGLTETNAVVEFDGNGILGAVPENDDGLIGLNRNNFRGKNKSPGNEKMTNSLDGKKKKGELTPAIISADRSGKSRRELINTDLTGNTIDPLPDRSLDIVEGQEIYWRVHAYDQDGNGRISSELRSAYAEIPDAPSAFSLTSPTNNATIETLSPTLNWESSEDSDMGDEVKYDLIWSLDNWETSDTVYAISGTSFSFNDPSLNNLPGADEFINAVLSRLLNPSIPELDNLPDDVTVDWSVDAVDMLGLRTEAQDNWSFSISVPEAPNGFNLVSPPHQTLFEIAQPLQLAWSITIDPDPDAQEVTYDVLLTDNPEINDPLLFPVLDTQLELPFIAYTPAEGDDQVFRWTVRAISSDDTTWASAGDEGYFEFAISDPDRPGEFTLSTPEDNAEQFSQAPVFSWSQPFDPDPYDPLTYTVYYSLDEWMTTDSLAGITETSFIFPERIVDDPEVNSLQTKSRPGSEKIKIEGDKTLSNPEDGIVRLDNQRQNIPDKVIQNELDEVDEIPDSSLISWKVRVQDSNSIGRWATPEEGWSFTFYRDFAPEDFSLLSPEHREVLGDSTALFEWEETSDPNGFGNMSYIIYISDTDDFVMADSVITNETSADILLTGYETGFRWWKVHAVDSTGAVTESNETWMFDLAWTDISDRQKMVLPTEFALHKLYPNPFNPVINAVIAVPKAESLTLTVIDLLGREVTRIGPEVYYPGYVPVLLDFSGKASGTYFLRLESPGKVIALKRMTLLK